MKIFFTLILLSVSLPMLACRCMRDNDIQSYIEADVIAIITIGKTSDDYPDKDNTLAIDTYQAKVKPVKIYKGDAFSELMVIGRSTSLDAGACGRLVKEGEKYFVALKNNKKGGGYSISLCSSMYQIHDDEASQKRLLAKEKLLTFLIKNKKMFVGGEFLDYHDNSEVYNSSTRKFDNAFGENLAKKLQGKFGIYKITINKESKISDIQMVKGFGLKDIDELNLQSIIKDNFEVKNGKKYIVSNQFIALTFD